MTQLAWLDTTTRAARVARFFVDHHWRPVGAGVQPDVELHALARYPLSGPAGRAAARRVDATIRTLPGFEDAELLEAWCDHNVEGAEPRGLARPERGHQTNARWPFGAR